MAAQVALLFPRAFWGKSDMFGRVPIDTPSRGEFYLFYSYNHVSGQPLLAALISGAAAASAEEQSTAEIVARLMTVLRGWFEPQGTFVPEPLQVSSPPASRVRNTTTAQWDGELRTVRFQFTCMNGQGLSFGRLCPKEIRCSVRRSYYV